MYSREYIRPSNERSKCRVVQGCSRSQKALYEISPIGLYGDPSKPCITLHFHAWAASEPSHRQIWFAFGDGRSGGSKFRDGGMSPCARRRPQTRGHPGARPRVSRTWRLPAHAHTCTRMHACTHAHARQAPCTYARCGARMMLGRQGRTVPAALPSRAGPPSYPAERHCLPCR